MQYFTPLKHLLRASWYKNRLLPCTEKERIEILIFVLFLPFPFFVPLLHLPKHIPRPNPFFIVENPDHNGRRIGERGKNTKEQREVMKSKSFNKTILQTQNTVYHKTKPNSLLQTKIKTATPLSSQKPKNLNHLLPPKSKSKT